MDPQVFQRAEQLFHEALSRTPSSRRAFLEEATSGDEGLATRVRRLIDRAESPSRQTMQVDRRLVADEVDADGGGLIDVTIGRFRLLELLGRGGFGCVYRAEQREPIQRQVALKILHAGMDSQQVIARFEAERQALALMEHPNIARVFDAGRTGVELGARPYFAMELVSGAPITAYCDQHGLGTEHRLELFITVCQAVQHAHQKGIIHRDLKPSNILVSEIDGVATPKVIDFGIAKATQPSPNAGSRAVTEARQLLGTPQYMSPEQADMDVQSIDTRSDIYSLGVVLYELLTGTTPLEPSSLREASYSRMQAMIRERAVERPSTRVGKITDNGKAQHPGDGDRGGDDPGRGRARLGIAALRRRLKGDLDWITLKALDHDRDRRYASASAFADDLRRHLQHEPVLASPPNALYRAGKFIRRHRVGVVAAALVALAVVGGAIGTTLAMLSARDAADQAMAVNQFMSDVLTSAAPDRQGADVRLVDVLKPASDEAAERFAQHPEVEARVRDLLGRVFLSIDMAPQSVSEFQRSADLQESLYGPDDRRSLDAQLLLIQSMLFQERTREGERMLASIVPRIERLFGQDDPMLIKGHRLQGSAYRNMGRLDESEAMFRAALQQARRQGVDDVQYIQILDGLLLTIRHRLTNEDADHARLIGEIEALARESVERAKRSLSPNAMPIFRGEAMLAEMAQRRGDPAKAVELAQSLIATWADRYGRCHVLTQMTMSVLAHASSDLGRHAEAADLCLQLVECARSKGKNSLGLVVRLNESLPYLELGGRWAEGEAAAREFGEVAKGMGGAHGDMLFNADMYRARFVLLQGKLDEAQVLLDALDSRRNEPDDPQSLARLDLTQGELLLRRGLFDEAERHLLAASATLGDVRVGISEAHRSDLIEAFIALYRAWGKSEKSAEYERMLEATLHQSPTTAPDA